MRVVFLLRVPVFAVAAAIVLLVCSSSAVCAQGTGPRLNPVGIAVEASGDLVLATVGEVVRVDRVTGNRTIVSDAGTGAGPGFGGLFGIAVEASGGLVISTLNGVMRVDPVTGDRALVSAPDIGAGPVPDFLYPSATAVEASGHLVVADSLWNRVLRVDPVTGDRTVVSGTDAWVITGAGPNFGDPRSIAVETSGNLVVLDGLLGMVVRVDPVTGDRTVVSDAGTGTGPAFEAPLGIAVEASGDLVVIDETLAAVLRVDPVTGDRTIVSGAGTGSGRAFERTASIAVEASGDLVVADVGLSAVLRVDPVTGDRTIVSRLVVPNDIAVEASGDLVVVDVDLGAVLRVNPATGDPAIVSGAGTGAGSDFGAPRGLAVEASGDLVVVDDFPAHGVVRVDPATGDRTIVSDAGTGVGPDFVSPQGIAVEASGDLAVIDTFLDAVVRVDPVTGDRTIVSDALDDGVVRRGAIAVEASGNLVLVGFMQGTAVLRVDPVTGDQTIVSDAGTGAGPGFSPPLDIAVEASGHLVAVVGHPLYAVVRVDPVTGDRTIVSDASTGAGPAFSDPTAIAVEASGQLVVKGSVLRPFLRVNPVTGDRESIEPGAPPTCGNGVTTGDEQCDDGNLIGCDGCSAACTLEGVCGDGVQTACEECDDNNAVDGDGCDSNCTTTGCGNGITTAGEACDDGAGNDSFCCSLSCQLVDTDGDLVCDRDDVCPSISDPGQANADGDTFGDSCDPCPADTDNDSDLDGFCVGASFNPPAIGGEDPCSRTGGAGEWLKPRVQFSRLLPPGGDEKMRITGRFVVGSSQPLLAPHLHAVRLRVTGKDGVVILDQTIPPGLLSGGADAFGWRVRGNPPTKWIFVDEREPPPLSGIRKLIVKDQSRFGSGAVQVLALGKNGSYPIVPGQEPLTVAVELNSEAQPPGNAPGVDQCGELTFQVEPPGPSCKFTESRLRCR